MKTIHAFSIALLLGAAAALGAFAATRTVTGSQAQASSTAAPAASTPAPATSIASRTASLDRWQNQLQRALHRRVPKLPKLVHFPRVVTPAVPNQVFVSQAAAPAPRTIYVRAKAPPAARVHEHEHEGDRSEGGSGDD
jgi:hypothetical protein